MTEQVELKVKVTVEGAEDIEKINKQWTSLQKSAPAVTTALEKQNKAVDVVNKNWKTQIPQLQALNPLLQTMGLSTLAAAGGWASLLAAVVAAGTQFPNLVAQFSDTGTAIAQYTGQLISGSEVFNLATSLSMKYGVSVNEITKSINTLLPITRNLGNTENYLNEAYQMHVRTGKSVADEADLLSRALNNQLTVVDKNGKMLQGNAAAQQLYNAAMQQGGGYTKLSVTSMDALKKQGTDTANVFKLVGSSMVIIAGQLAKWSNVKWKDMKWFDSKPFKDFGDSVSKSFKTAGEGITDFFRATGGYLTTGFQDIGGSLKNVGENVATASSKVTGFLSTAGTTILNGFKAIGADAKKAWETAFQFGEWLKDKIQEGIDWLNSNAGQLLSDAWKGVISGLKTVWNDTVKVADWIKDKITEGWTWLKDSGKNLLSMGWQDICNAAKAIWDLNIKVADWIRDKVMEGWNWLRQSGQNLLNAAWQDICNAVKSVFDFNLKIEEWIRNAISNALNWLATTGRTWLVNGFNDIINGLKDAWSDFANWVSGLFGGKTPASATPPAKTGTGTGTGSSSGGGSTGNGNAGNTPSGTYPNPNNPGHGVTVVGNTVIPYAEGGVAINHQIAEVAESEPEYMIPLSKLGSFVSGMGGGGTTVNLYVQGVLDSSVVDQIANRLDSFFRLRGGR